MTCERRTDDFGVGLHVSVLLRQLEGLVVAARHHQELDRRAEIVQLLEEPAEKNNHDKHENSSTKTS